MSYLHETAGAPDADFHQAKGALAVDKTNGAVYINTGDATTPVWQALTNGTGTFTGTAAPDGTVHYPKGALYVNTTDRKTYTNTGTFASPVWGLIVNA